MLAGTLIAAILLSLLRLSPVWAEPAALIVHGSPAEKRIALTFDDGPSPYTQEICSLLCRYQAKATFFVLGCHALQYPRIIRGLLKHGHEVENHSFSHKRFPQVDKAAWQQELERTEAELDCLGSPDRNLFRPPYSNYNQRFLNYLGHLHERLVLWSVDSGDWRGLDDVAIAANVLKGVHNGAIIIFHDGDELGRRDHKNTVDALRIVLPALKSRGYEMVTVSELLHIPNTKGSVPSEPEHAHP
ncbi:MAG: polysaccharide deacetylase family protein [Deltaproteobacteria bacterium]|nr:polysaccharide deacetylase family protein [Deltaproteobacteria bacterium]